MYGRTIVRVIAVVALVAIAIGVGAAVYNAGVTAGLSESAQQALASGQPVANGPSAYGPYWHGWGGGFGFPLFGIFFWILGISLILGLLRAAFGWGRWGGRGRGPGGWYGGRREMVEDWHREMHRRQDGDDHASS